MRKILATLLAWLLFAPAKSFAQESTVIDRLDFSQVTAPASSMNLAREATAARLAITASSLDAESRFAGVRLVVGRHGSVVQNSGLDEVEGVLSIDAEAGRLRFEAPGRPVLEVALDAVIALHYEESSYPRRLFRRRGLYLTVHHTGAGGEAEVAIFQLPKGAADDCLAAVARSTGQPLDRSRSTTSFLGLPIHTGIGDVVYVTQNDGRTRKGTVTQLGLSGISLGALGRIDEASVRRIDVSDPIWDGAVTGVILSVVPAFLSRWSSCLHSCSTVGFLTPGGWGMVAAGAFIGGVVDKKVMRNAYRRPEEGPTHSVRWTPVLGRGTAGFALRASF
jgi:hypothetical protein